MALCAAVSSASAQENVFGLTAGAALTTTSADDAQLKVGGSIGAYYDVTLSDAWHLQPRLQFGYEEAESKGSAKTAAFFSQWNVTLPVLLSYRFALSPSGGLRVNIGPYGQYALFGRERQQFTDGSHLGWWHGGFSRRFSCGLQVGAAFECTPRLQLLLDGRLSFKSSELSLDGKQRTLMLGLGYRL